MCYNTCKKSFFTATEEKQGGDLRGDAVSKMTKICPSVCPSPSQGSGPRHITNKLLRMID